MFALCVEASHCKGFGHLFRMINFCQYLKKVNEKCVFCINKNRKAISILNNNSLLYEIVDYKNEEDWEKQIIKRYSIHNWVNDRLNTDFNHSKKVKSSNVNLITFDDLGDGAKCSDINVCGLFFQKKVIDGKKVLRGTNYLILNSDIDFFKRKRRECTNVLVSMGGSDTYGVTIKVIDFLKKSRIPATIYIGPAFEHEKELSKIVTSDYRVVRNTNSLVSEFVKYDLAVTGGGITPFEANASGLPCLIIANEEHEIDNGLYLDSIGSSIFLGYYKNFSSTDHFDIKDIDIMNMSEKGLNNLKTVGAENIYREIISL